ncbi:MAG: mandelate racemase/muconate lactonizing enzyme family protein [bacterium]|nr:mandelate racemase/muconate lactonizing enzyme family protein [bacterium]
MKITRITATPIRVPRTQQFTSSLGRSLESENAVVEIDTDEGITGLGEVCSIWDRKGRGQAEDINDLLAQTLLGQDPFRIADIHAVMDGLLHRSYPAKAGIDMALYDIVGKTLNTPIYNLLGGLVRDRVLLSHSLSMGEPAQVAEMAASLVAQGYKTVKAKIGQDQKADLATVQAIRNKVGPDVTLRLDANMGWANAKEAVRNIKALEPFDIELVEQPLHSSDLVGLHHVRDHVDTPIMADESVWTPADAMACIRAEAVDVFNVYVAEAGGIYPASQIFAIAEAARLPCIIGSMPELGIGTAAQAHLAFAMRNLGYASDVNGFIYHADDIIHETFQIDDGYLAPPPGPGLGVSLNRDKLEQYRF